MTNKPSRELPIRSKIKMATDIVKTIYYLHHGERVQAEWFLNELKARALYLDEDIQQSVLMFAEQISFQFDYDPYHKVTPEVQQSADHLIENLGFSKPKE